LQKNSCNFYSFFTYKTLAINGNLAYKDFLLVATSARGKQEKVQKRVPSKERGGGGNDERERMADLNTELFLRF
jgi:hypothetical protein